MKPKTYISIVIVLLLLTVYVCVAEAAASGVDISPEFVVYDTINDVRGYHLVEEQPDDIRTVGIPQEAVKLYTINDLSQFSEEQQKQMMSEYAEAASIENVSHIFWIDVAEEYLQYFNRGEEDDNYFLDMYVKYPGKLQSFQINNKEQEICRQTVFDSRHVKIRDTGLAVMTFKPDTVDVPVFNESEAVISSPTVDAKQRADSGLPEVVTYLTGDGIPGAEIRSESGEELIDCVPAEDIIILSANSTEQLPEEESEKFLETIDKLKDSEKNLISCFYLTLTPEHAKHMEGKNHTLGLLLDIDSNPKTIEVNNQRVDFEPITDAKGMYFVLFPELGIATIYS